MTQEERDKFAQAADIATQEYLASRNSADPIQQILDQARLEEFQKQQSEAIKKIEADRARVAQEALLQKKLQQQKAYEEYRKMNPFSIENILSNLNGLRGK